MSLSLSASAARARGRFGTSRDPLDAPGGARGMDFALGREGPFLSLSSLSSSEGVA